MSAHDLGRALLDSVVADPDDDAPRLVYADWLTLQGDERGTFIRDQCALASIDRSDPRYSELYRKTERALRDHKAQWCAPLSADLESSSLPYPHEIRFARGFPDWIWVDAAGASDLARLRAKAPLRGAHVEYGAGVDLLSPIGQALEAGLVEISIGGEGSRTLAKPSKLDKLGLLRGLGLNQPIEAPLDHIKGLLTASSLRWVSLSESGLGDVRLGKLIDAGALDNIDCIILDGASIISASLRHLSVVRSERPLSLSLLRTPGLGSSYYRWLDGARLRALALGSRGSHTIDLHPKTLERLEHLELLGFSSFHGSRLGDIPFSSLRSLSLDSCRLDRDQITAIARSGLLDGLVGLSLSGTLGGDSDLIRLLEVLPAGRLCSLDLSGLSFSSRSLEALSEWPGLAGVVELGLGDLSHVQGAGIDRLTQAPGFDPTELGLSFTRPKQALIERFGDAIRRSLSKRSAVFGPFAGRRDPGTLAYYRPRPF